MSRKKCCDIPVPLYLIGAAITRGVKQRGAKITRISVIRTHFHHYRIRYSCRALDPDRARTGKLPKINGIDPQQVAGIDRWNEDHD